jgi:HPr kinase/phosphorylase
VSRDEHLLHASAVAWPAGGLIILGASGSGKSGLALRLMARGARLIADDQVILARDARGEIFARAPAPLVGLIEARGIGIIQVEAVQARVALAVDLGRLSSARMPQPQMITYLGTAIRLISGGNVPNLDEALTILMQNGCMFRE